MEGGGAHACLPPQNSARFANRSLNGLIWRADMPAASKVRTTTLVATSREQQSPEALDRATEGRDREVVRMMRAANIKGERLRDNARGGYLRGKSHDLPNH
jgi:hypothetical protein